MKKKYYETKESINEYIRLAEGHSGEILINKFKDFLPSGSDLLEIGSGPGTDWQILNQYFTVVGSDFSVEFLNHLTTNIPNGEFLHLNAITLTTDKKFDGIYSNKVLHHLTDSELMACIERQHAILKTDGIISHSFWRGEGEEYFKGLFVNYHSHKEIEKLFSSHFKIILIENYKEFDTDDSIVIIGSKK